MKALINISGNEACAQILSKKSEFIKRLAQKCANPSFILADLACMLLNNLSKSARVCEVLMHREGSTGDALLVKLVDAFSNLKNPKASLDFLGPVIANVALLKSGREILMDAEISYPLSKILAFTEHDSVIRRGGAISAIKNCCMSVDKHDIIYQESKMNAIPFILLPLAGPEELDEEDMDGMPLELQYLEDSKIREQDAYLRLQLLESLIALSTTREGREYLRSVKVYPIIREMHLAETDDQCAAAAENVVQLLMRDEENGTIEEVEETEEISGLV